MINSIILTELLNITSQRIDKSPPLHKDPLIISGIAIIAILALGLSMKSCYDYFYNERREKTLIEVDELEIEPIDVLDQRFVGA